MKRRGAIALIVIAALLLLALLALRWALRPDVLGPRVLAMAGDALGLDISATGFDYRLRGTPQLIAHGAVAREPGAATPVLTAERILVAVPWSTLRARGADPVVARVELDAPQLDLAAFLRWWSQRPPSDAPPPTLREGLRVVRGSIVGDGWALQDVGLDLPRFAPSAPLRATARGRYLAGTLQAPFDLHLAMTRPTADAGLGLAGTIAPGAEGWRLPTRLRLSTRLHGRPHGDDGPQLQRLRLSARARYLSDTAVQPFVLGLAGEGAFADGGVRLDPAALVLRGEALIPHLRARGRLALADGLALDLDGELAQWPDAWPALPPPLGPSASPLPFALRYQGPATLSAPVALLLQRDQARFDGRFRVDEIARWVDVGSDGSPLPPLDGRVTAPRIEISGAVLHGVDIGFEDTPAAEAESP